jgi:hypothetical protein
MRAFIIGHCSSVIFSSFTVARCTVGSYSNRPHITGQDREFFANVTMVGGLINKVK